MDAYVNALQGQIDQINATLKEMVVDIRKKAHESVQRYISEINAKVVFELDYKDEEGHELTLKDSLYKGK